MDFGTQRINRISIADEVVKRLQKRICSGEMAVGEKLPTESELQESLGVGRSTIREALRALQAIGLIEMKSGRGAYVKNTRASSIADWIIENEDLLSDLMQVRKAVETLAVELAAENGTPYQIARIRKTHEAFANACAQCNPVAITQLDEEFHQAIFTASNNVFLEKMSDVLAQSIRPFRALSFAHNKLVAKAVPPHARILDAIEARNPPRAIAAMREHLDLSMKDMQAVAPEALAGQV